jgi:SWI/SNF-related matrix-associated actin-dependent regulator 1 of chromatin subfamily A
MREADFRDRFNPVFKGETADGKVFIRESVHRLPELQNRLRANFMVRRLKRDVLTQLPPVRYNLHHVDETGAIKKALEAERMLDIDPEAMTGVDMVTRGHISVVRHQMGVAKAPQVADYVDTLLDGGEDKIVLFGWHIEVLDILEQRLGRHGVLRIDGSVPPHRRHERVAQFQADPDKHIMLGNIQAMGVGTDGLQNAASHVVFAEVSWVPGDNEQGVSRLERMGQTTPVIAEFLVAPGSFDEKILGSALRKLRNIRSALDVG